jgi:hypothetical protein
MIVNGVAYNVLWARFKVGTSLFLPCLKAEEARQEVIEVTSRLGFKVQMKLVVEEGIRGLRVWRVR